MPKEIHLVHNGNSVLPTESNHARVKQIAVSSAKNIGPAIHGCVHYRVVVGVGKDHGFSNHNIHEVGDLAQVLHVFADLVVSETMTSKQTRISQDSCGLIEEKS